MGQPISSLDMILRILPGVFEGDAIAWFPTNSAGIKYYKNTNLFLHILYVPLVCIKCIFHSKKSNIFSLLMRQKQVVNKF